MTSPVHTRLRHETRADHDAVEAAMGLMAPGLTADFYRRRLEQLLGFYRPLERRLARHPELTLGGLSLGKREKAPSLAADVSAIGGDPSEVADCLVTPDVETAARAYGCLYVLEGATLGGRVIGPHVGRALGLTPDRGAQFFAGYGARTKAMWATFCLSLAAFADAAPVATDDIVAAARDTFTALRDWIR